MINIYYFLSSIGIYGSMAYYLLHHSAVSGTPAETLGILVLRPRYDLPSQSTLKHNSVHFLKKSVILFDQSVHTCSKYVFDLELSWFRD
jgi:hypothetical protein